MATVSIQNRRSGFEAWQDGVNKAVTNPAWDVHDCDIRIAVNEYNRHLSNKQGYIYLDWKLIKAMIWVETGAKSAEWGIKPMQIGVNGDPGLTAFLSNKEGGELILPPALKGRLNSGNARVSPYYNIRAGIGYMLMRMANFEYKTILGAGSKIYEVTVKAGGSLDKIARIHGSTPDVLKKLNPSATVLRSGQVLKYQKATVQRVISGWRLITTCLIAQRYNGNRDPNYAKKLDYALALVQKGETAICTQ